MGFWRLVRVVSAKKWLIIGFVVVAVLTIAVAAPKPKVSYMATCKMSPSSQAMHGGFSLAATAVNANGANALPPPDREVVLSNLVILASSSEVMHRAAEFLALPEIEQQRRHSELPGYKQIPTLLYSKYPEQPLDESNWGSALSVTPIISMVVGEKGTLSNVISIKVKIPNGDDAQFIANAVGVALADTYQSKSHAESRKYIEFLSASMQEASARLREIDGNIAAAKQAHRVVALDPETQAAVASLATLESSRDTAQASVQESAATVRDIDFQLARQPLVRTDSLPAEMNPRIVRLRDELAKAEADQTAAGSKYTPEHPVYKAAAAQVKVIKDRIAQEGTIYKSSSLNDLHNALVKQRSDAASRMAAAVARLRVANTQVAAEQNKLSGIPGAQRDLTELTREQQTAADDYTTYAQKLALARITDRESRETGSIILFDPARSAAGPLVDGPRKPVLLVYGLVLSLVAGLAFCVWLDSIDNRLRNGRDVENLLDLPAVGLIPELKEIHGGLPKLTHIYPLSPAAESYKLLRTQILLAHRDRPFKSLMVASSKPGQGATTTVCNLAIALAQIGKRVVLIDADMRRPSLHGFFGVSNATGLSTMLQGQVDALDGIKQTEVDNLIVIPAGPPPLNPSELLASERMWEIVKRLQEHCDFVLFDAPSTVVFSDGQVLAGWTDVVLFVVSANQVPSGSEKRALELLRRANAHVIGTVVNKMSFHSVDSCRFHSDYYAGNGSRSSLPALGTDDETTAETENVANCGPAGD